MNSWLKHLVTTLNVESAQANHLRNLWVLGKPNDRDHAKQMLTMMSGRIHHVFSGVCLWKRPGDQCQLEVESTKLKMDEVSNDDLEKYLDTDQWIGKAGAFGYQDGLDWIHIIEGNESNVVGLPMKRLAKMLEAAKNES